MIATICAMALLMQQGGSTAPAEQAQQAGPEKAAPLISKMFAKYAAAQTMVGTINLTVTTPYGSRECKTAFQYERPSKVYLIQVLKVTDPVTSIVSSDGKSFTYDYPGDIKHALGHRLQEPVKQPDGTEFPVGMILEQASSSISDNSAPLQIAFARTENLQFIAGQWATLKYRGKATVAGQEANWISGDWRPYQSGRIDATFDLYISDDGDLLRFIKHENEAVPAQSGVQQPPISITSEWDCEFKPGATPDPKLFQIVK